MKISLFFFSSSSSSSSVETSSSVEPTTSSVVVVVVVVAASVHKRNESRRFLGEGCSLEIARIREIGKRRRRNSSSSEINDDNVAFFFFYAETIDIAFPIKKFTNPSNCSTHRDRLPPNASQSRKTILDRSSLSLSRFLTFLSDAHERRKGMSNFYDRSFDGEKHRR